MLVRQFIAPCVLAITVSQASVAAEPEAQPAIPPVSASTPADSGITEAAVAPVSSDSEVSPPATKTGVSGGGKRELPVTIITARRVESSVDSAPGNTTVVTRDDIDKTPRAGIKELVSNQVGVITGQLRGQSDLASSIELRGVTGQSRNLVMIDGIPLNTSYSGQIQAIGGLNTEDLKQVEIVRGPFSSLYGSSAMGGAVNFITAMPDADEYRASIGYGDAFEEGRSQKHLVKGSVSVAQKFSDSFKAKLSYGWMDHGGYQSDFATTTTAPTGVTGFYSEPTYTGGTKYVLGSKGDGAINKHDLLGKAEFKATDTDVFNITYIKSHLHNQYNDPVSYLRSTTTGEIVYSAGTNPRESAFLSAANDMSNTIYALDWRRRLQDSNISMKYSNLYVDEWYTSTSTTSTRAGGPGTFTPRISENTVLDLLWEKPLGSTLLLLGGQYKRTNSIADTYNLTSWLNIDTRTNKTTSSGGKEKVIGMFADIQTEITTALTASVGGRFERWTGLDGYTADYTAPANTTLNRQYESQTKTNFSPKLTLGYLLAEGTRVKASWGKAFRAPDALVLYRNYGTTTQYISNPNLKPELSQSYDVGVEQSTPANGQFKAYVFHTEITDLISTRDLNPTGTIKERINVGKVKSEGLELSLVQPMTDEIRLSTNYTKTLTKVLENPADPGSVGKQLTSVPRDMFNLGLTYDDSIVYGALNCRYSSKRYFLSNNSDTVSGVLGSYDPYTLVDAKVGYRITKNIDINLSISNLLDKEFYNSIKTEGRAWFAQTNLKF